MGDPCPEGLVGIQDKPRWSRFEVRTVLARGLILPVDSSLRRCALARSGSREISPSHHNGCFPRLGIRLLLSPVAGGCRAPATAPPQSLLSVSLVTRMLSESQVGFRSLTCSTGGV